MQNKKTFIVKIIPFKKPAFRLTQVGFTLLELMVVLVLIGVILSFAMLSVGDGGRNAQLELEAQRLATLTQLASQTAMMQVREIGIQFEENHYQFLSLDTAADAEQPEWINMPEEHLLRQRQLPIGMVMQITVEDSSLELAAVQASPQVLVLSSGEVTPFTAQFFFTADDSEHYEVSVNILGEPSMAWVTDL